MLSFPEVEQTATEEEDRRIRINYSYPNNKDFEYTAHMERIDFDKEKERDLLNNEGFIISNPKATIKKDIKDPNGIWSPLFGQSLGDLNPFIDRYSCSCGNLKSRINNGIECPICHTLCKFIDDNYKIFGWISLNPEYPIIHPDIYKQLDILFGKSKFDKKSRNRFKGSKLKNMLDYDVMIDLDGNEVDMSSDKPDEPYYGKGFLYFISHFDEILEYYHQKNPKKEDVYQDIIADREKVFTHSLPVFTSHLRPMDISSGTMYFEKCTAIYNMMVKLAYRVNKNKTKIDRNPKAKAQQLFNLQMKTMELYDEVTNILSGKKGVLRGLVGGEILAYMYQYIY